MAIAKYKDKNGQWKRLPQVHTQMYNDAPIKERLTAVEQKAEQNKADIAGKQDTLVSGKNIKTVNGESVLGSGNVDTKPKGGYNRALYEAMPEVKFNEATGYYELYKEFGGLIDVTEKQMREIYNSATTYSNDYAIANRARAIIPKVANSLATGKVFISYGNAELIALNSGYINSQIRITNNSPLVTIVGDLLSANLKVELEGNPKLVNANFKAAYGEGYSILVQDSPLLSYNSVNSIIVNTIEGKYTATMRVHPTIFSYLDGSATTEAYQATGHTKEKWMAIVTNGSAKKITFSK